jgi:ubiquinone/menaquinone biosynthesis C-methylase UbiE
VDPTNGLNLGRVYDYRFEDLQDSARSGVWTEIAVFLHRRFGSPDRVLDTAGGLGEFIANVPAADRWAVDLVDHGLSSLPDVTVRIASFFDADIPDNYFDLVFISNLLEHLATPDEVAQFLARARSVLRPGGVVVIMGPNFKYTAKDYFDCADHILPLTHIAVAEHLYAAEFEVVETTPKFLPFSFRSRLPSSPLLARAYLKAPLTWKLLGKQFLVAGRKS